MTQPPTPSRQTRLAIVFIAIALTVVAGGLTLRGPEPLTNILLAIALVLDFAVIAMELRRTS